MPCYLFTYHAYGSWLPDHDKGFVLRKKGIQSTDIALAKTYRQRMQETEVTLSETHQQAAIEAIRNATKHIACRLYIVVTDPTHIHMLTSWRDEKTWQQKRNSYKRAITIALKTEYEKRTWLSEGSSRKQIKDREHFEYLITQYLPKHCGWKWSEGEGLFK